ncbi:hypothetical protein TKK_0016015 [Trichogramma kaykai]
MASTTLPVLEILEHAWVTRERVLVNMKIEFGERPGRQVDIIDYSWQLWPKSNKGQKIKMHFTCVADETVLHTLVLGQELLRHLFELSRKIAKHVGNFGFEAEMIVTSAYKASRIP